MSFRTALRQVTVAPRRIIAAPSARSFSILSSRAMPARSEMSENDASKLDKEISKNHKGETKSPHPEHAPGWNETLASESEAAVKAENAHSGPPTDKLVKDTVDHIHEKHGKD